MIEHGKLIIGARTVLHLRPCDAEMRHSPAVMLHVHLCPALRPTCELFVFHVSRKPGSRPVECLGGSRMRDSLLVVCPCLPAALHPTSSLKSRPVCEKVPWRSLESKSSPCPPFRRHFVCALDLISQALSIFISVHHVLSGVQPESVSELGILVATGRTPVCYLNT